MRPSSLVLVTIDCLRADHVGFQGYNRQTTPFLDCLSGESLIFENAIAAGTPTYYALPGIHASRHPLALGRDIVGIAPEENTLASVLQECGFRTAAINAGNPYLSPRFGYDRGFDDFRDFLSEDEVHATGFAQPSNKFRSTRFRTRANSALAKVCHAFSPLNAVYDELYFQYCHRGEVEDQRSFDALRKFPSAENIVDHAIPWLEENSGSPFFLWLHLMDPHGPYFPKSDALELMHDDHISERDAIYLNSYWRREGLSQSRLVRKRKGIVSLYDACIRWADEQIRRLSEILLELNVWDKCVLAVTADHGEEFLDHGGRFHPPVKLADELIRVPLLVRVPGSCGSRYEGPVSMIDLAPTLLDVLGVPAPADFRGRSRLGNKKKTSKAVVTECVHGCTNPFQPASRQAARILSVRNATHKLVIDFSREKEELFDLRSDPGELCPLPFDSSKSVRKELLAWARKHLAESHQSLDVEQRNAALVRDLRLEWAHPAAIASNLS